MSRRKKILFWVMGVIGVLLVLLLVFLLVLPTLVNLEPVREKIHAAISQKVKGHVEYEEVDLSFFPRPRVIIHHGSLSIPGKVTGTLESLTVYPRILPLLKGRVRISMLRAEAPEFKMELPERPEEKEGGPKPFSLESIEENVAPVLALGALEVPSLNLVVDQGRLDLSRKDVSVLRFQDIHGRISLPPDRLEIDLACNSNLWESISVEGRLTPEDFKGNGRIRVKDFKPHVLTDHLFSLATLQVGDSHLNLDISLETDGFKAFQGEVQGSLPLLTLQRAHEKLAIRGKSLKGAFSMDEDRITVSLAELELDYPQLTISGALSIDQTPPRVSLELEGREVDVYSMREAALAVAGILPINREILGMAKEGKIPSITLNAQGSSLADLGKVENIFIKGSIVEGKIFLPGGNIGLEGVDLDVEDVKGEVIISQGILEGKHLGARWENAHIREGILRLGLKGEDPPFHLEAAVEVDMAQLPPLLEALIKHETFVEEIARTYDIRGRAVGRVILGESIGSIKARADFFECNLSARYELLPYPLEIKGVKLSYAGDNVYVRNLSGTLGRSSFSEISARLSFEEPPYLEISSGKSSVFLGEIYPWLSSLEGLNGGLKDLNSVKGTIALSNLELKGPLLKPEKWRFRTKGEVRNLSMQSTLLPGRLAVPQGTFEAIPERISFTDVHISFLDASLRISARLHDYLEGLEKAEFTLQGNVGPEANQWVSNLIDAPPKLRIRAPLSLSGVSAGWEKNGRTSFSGNFALKDGPSISVDVALHPEELIINNLLIKDRASHASFGLMLKEREFRLDFDGHLDKTTLDKLLTENQILTGRVDGDFEAHILMDDPMRSSAQGEFRGVGLGYPLELKVPLVIEDVSLDAKKNKLKVESALITWGDSHLNLEGNMQFSEEDFLFDMNLSADGIGWERIEEILEEEDQKSDLQQREDLEVPPLEGILRVKMGYFRYDRFTWRPFHADISFDHEVIKITVNEANLCGISTPGMVKVTPQDLSLDFTLACRNQEPGPTLTCLSGQELGMTGNFYFKGNITARGKHEELAQSLRGNLEYGANDGRIYRARVLARILAYLNVTEVFKGGLPDMGKEGLAYDVIKVRGNLENGKLRIEEAILDGPTVEIASQGEIDLINQEIDIRILVAPFKTVDSVVKRIPMVRGILKGTLVAIPVRVRGDLSNPRVIPLSSSAVGSLTGIMKKTLHLPVRVVQPRRRKKEENP